MFHQTSNLTVVDLKCFPQKFEEWKKDLPDFGWLNDVIPDPEKVDTLSRDIRRLVKSIAHLPDLPRPPKVCIQLKCLVQICAYTYCNFLILYMISSMLH